MSSTNSSRKVVSVDEQAFENANEQVVDEEGFPVVDETVLMGYPGSRQSFWQRIGRSGRGTRDALSVFVPSHSTLDQYILQHPEYVLEENHESAVVDLDNNPVYLQQLNCAAQELPPRATTQRISEARSDWSVPSSTADGTVTSNDLSTAA